MTAVLLVEDDERISEPLIRVLRGENFDVEHVANGRDAIAAVTTKRPDLVLLDLTLPDLDGLDVCRTIRIDHADLPIIMLTARSEEVDVIVGLNAGADDYIAKPFRLAELVARIRARLRIAEQSASTANCRVRCSPGPGSNSTSGHGAASSPVRSMVQPAPGAPRSSSPRRSSTCSSCSCASPV